MRGAIAKGPNQEMIDDHRKHKRRTIIFYSESPNTETVLNWIRDLPQADRSALGLDLDFVQSEWRVGARGDSDGAPTERVGRVGSGLFGRPRRARPGHPLCQKLEDGLWEMQSAMPSGKMTSLIFFVADGTLHVVQGQIKTGSAVAPDQQMLARQRMGVMQNSFG